MPYRDNEQQKAYWREYRLAHLEEKREYLRLYRERHAERLAEAKRHAYIRRRDERRLARGPEPELQLTREQAAWLAGIIDGEGCISLHPRKRHNGRPGFHAAPSLQITNTSPELIQWLAMHVPFARPAVLTRDKRSENRKPAYHWAVYGERARRVIRDVRPWLLIKAPQAELVLRLQQFQEEWHEHRDQAGKMEPLPDEYFAFVEDALVTMRALNHRGAPPSSKLQEGRRGGSDSDTDAVRNVGQDNIAVGNRTENE